MRKAVDTTKAFAGFSPAVRKSLADLRRLILETARMTPGVGAIEEGLRWGQLSFLTTQTGSGSTIRIDGFRDDPEKLAIFFHCQSGLVDEFRTIYGTKLEYAGQRAIVLRAGDPLPRAELQHCVALALTHHLRRKARRRRD